MTPQLIVAWALIGVGSVIVLVLMLLPSHKVALERRRFGAAEHSRGLTRMADRATATVEHLLAGRGNSFNSILEEAGVHTPLKDLVVIVFAVCMAFFALGLVLGNPCSASCWRWEHPSVLGCGCRCWPDGDAASSSRNSTKPCR